MQYLGAVSKTTDWSQFISKANHSISQQSKSVPQPLMLKKLKWTSSEVLQHLLELTTKYIIFITGSWNAKVGSQEIPVLTGKLALGVQTEAYQRLTGFCQENTLVIANTLFQLHKRWLYTWTSPDGQYWNQIDYILCSQMWKSCMQRAEKKPGAECSSDHQLFIAKFRLQLNKVEKTTRPFRYDLN